MVAAPMAGGASTPLLVSTVSEAGGLGFLAGGYKTAESIDKEIAAVRESTNAPFGVNLFVPWFPMRDLSSEKLEVRARSVEKYALAIAEEAERVGVGTGISRPMDDDEWSQKIDVLVAARCPIVSFTFGVPPADVVERLRAVGSLIVVTVTNKEEAIAAHGADALCVQGPEAGGHRGTHDPFRSPGEASLVELLHDLREIGVPLIAAGGISREAHARAALGAGATSVQCGTLFIRSPESGANEHHKSALAAPWAKRTVLTRAFSGRFARGIENSFIRAHGASAPPAYPEVNQLTQPLRAAAARAGDPDRMALWAGTGYRDAEVRPASDIVTLLRTWTSDCRLFL